MNNLFCKSCGCDFSVSDRKIQMSDNDWWYCPKCGSGNVEHGKEVDCENL